MTMVPPVRYALLRDGLSWGCMLPAELQVGSDGFLKFVPAATALGVIAATSTMATIESGRLDAGMDSDWERVAVQATTPTASSAALDTFTSADPNATPQWRAEPGLNVLLHHEPGPAPDKPGTRRYLWLRIRLNRDDTLISPVLEQVQAQTSGRSDLEDLPAIYRRDDRSSRFLERWLALFHRDRQAFEQTLADMPHVFDAHMARADQLAWVAQCLGFEPPEDLTPAQLRALLERVPELYERRGTITGIEDWAEIYSGLRPKIIEAWRSRRVWQLDTQSLLGFDTMLAASAPDGLIVPGQPLTDPTYLGLLRETFGGPSFDWVNGTPRIDPTLDFDSTPLVLAPTNAQGTMVDVATLRWTGQIKPRHAERYTLTLRLEGAAVGDDVRVRFWIDGRPLVEATLWADASANTAGAVQVTTKLSRTISWPVDELRWYPLRLEVRTTANSLRASLAWISRSQRSETVPASCLYALIDDRVDTALTQASGFDVGSAVVGSSGPQTPDQYGQGLFSDSAHLFTVLVPPACECTPKRHQRLRQAIDAEKPAHTDYHLCFLKPRMRVGFQARLGIDAIVARGQPPARLDQTVLGRTSFLADDQTATTETASATTPSRSQESIA